MATWQPSNACSRYGASMGRDSTRDADIREIVAQLHGGKPPRMSLQRVKLDAGGYDAGGAYWGTGEPLWRASDDTSNPTCDTIELFFRAPTREQAKRVVLGKVPTARFYR